MTQRVGFVIDGQAPTWRGALTRECPFAAPWRGWPSETSIGRMRYGWVSQWVNGHATDLLYELYRPTRSYAAVVFLKSMTPCRALAGRMRADGVKVLFDANVDYFTPAEGRFFYDGMAPTAQQAGDAVAMANLCDGVIGDSPHVAEVAANHSARAWWVPDNVWPDLIVRKQPWAYDSSRKLPLLWCGQACKLFELLLIREVLESFAGQITLRLVSDPLDAIDRCYEPYRTQLREMLEVLEYEHLPFTDIPGLMQIYDQGGVAISPRFLDNTYNLGHTEWKLTLPMARGRMALCSPQSSYLRVRDRDQAGGIQICETARDWGLALEKILSGEVDWDAVECSATNVVRQYYATDVVAKEHLQAVRSLLETAA